MSGLLIVDDAALMRMKIRGVAEEAGWSVAGEAANGIEAVASFHDLRPDLVTMDLVMPRLDGLAALRAIRGEVPDAKIVMVSAVDQKEKLKECIDAGAVDFIVKPFDPDRLREFFERYLSKDSANAADSSTNPNASRREPA